MDVVVGEHRGLDGYPSWIGLLVDIGIALGAFVLATLLAVALGAANFGTALGVGQVVFVFAATAVILLRD
jgi:hypothetical protein